tara:strand:- start:124 stop:540 length:417 start_codon:yes stop_codon:yes gene_type:complete
MVLVNEVIVEEKVVVKDDYMILFEDGKVIIDFEFYAEFDEQMKDELMSDYRSLECGIFPTFINFENLDNIHGDVIKVFFQELESQSTVGTVLVSNDEKSEIITRVIQNSLEHKLPCKAFKSITEAVKWTNKIQLFSYN